MTPEIEIFKEWFGSPYYHLLYQNRDITEAKRFLDNLIGYLNVGIEDRILDIGCGRGRHAIYLNSRGLDVTGIDISRENILEAGKLQNDRLHFFVHDMRLPFRKNAYEYVFNFFTSFGYFDTSTENERVVKAAYENLIKGGRFLIDFLNPYKVIHELAPSEVKQVGGITFHLTKKINDGMIVKDIKFADRGKQFHFQEKVKAIRRKEFLQYFDHAGFRVVEIFGDYELSDYEPEESERMIFLLKK